MAQDSLQPPRDYAHHEDCNEVRALICAYDLVWVEIISQYCVFPNQKRNSETKKVYSASVTLINSFVMAGIQIRNTSAKKLQHELQHLLIFVLHWRCQVIVFFFLRVK